MDVDVKYPGKSASLALEIKALERRKELPKIIGEAAVRSIEILEWAAKLPKGADEARRLAEEASRKARAFADECEKEMSTLCEHTSRLSSGNR
ncbi:hypothetical protein HIM_04100 [Hirsutella minnesotensis 3608]|uniref:Uncharacterized protein n=1 Tax=Hirsutella minnesotensis 3608 TaxID=1043627 RepID=A0A0F7ZLG4_9HYPO|nr:hypothetical protein HIM_04100 [Hirsutella minnesotensis 3608]